MKFSIIIPAYKCELTLEKTVQSIQQCGLSDFEIIIVDDGSPDGTPVLCDLLEAKYENIRCFHQLNAGVSAARNHGLAEARGDYVWFFDSDDLVDNCSMKRCTEVIDEYAPDILIFGMRFEFYDSRTLTGQWSLVYDEEGLFSQEELDSKYSELFHRNALSSVCNKLFKNDMLSNNEIQFDTELFLMEDYHFSLNALHVSKRIYLLPQDIYRYIHRKQNTTRRKSEVSHFSRVENIAEYIAPFESLLEDHLDLLQELYFMILTQKIGTEDLEQIKMTAKMFANSQYSSELFLSYCSEGQKALANKLLKGKYRTIYFHNITSRWTRQIKRAIKTSVLYRLIRGSKPRVMRL